MAKPAKTGKPASPGKSAASPGHQKQAAGAKSAKAYAPGQMKKK